jgi:N-acetylmuramoyl-L-alanine amidase
MRGFFEKIFSTLFSSKNDEFIEGEINDGHIVDGGEFLEEEIIEDVDFGIPSKYSNVVILIDNGHGNTTLGKRSPYSYCKAKPEIPFYEYEWNREIARMVVNELEKKGLNAVLLVPENGDISLSERVKRANNYCNEYGTKNVLLLSIHANASGNGSKWMSAKGWSAYTSVGQTNSDKLTECLYNEAEKNFIGRKIRTDFQDGDRDWETNFYICQKTKCVAVLTENFFYDNEDDVKYILSDEGKNAVVKTHVDGILSYLNKMF